ncbi:MAG: hypothetical protein ABFR05_00185 [Bacteroidota bacterium]
MKKTIYFIAFIIFSNLFFACTADDITEEEINSTTMEVVATGEDDADEIDDEKD